MVTIIILIILAAVSLTILLGENGIIYRTRDAAIAYDFAAFKEQLILDIHDVVTDLNMKGKTVIKPNDEEFMSGMRDKGYEVTDNGDETITVKKDNKTAIIDETWGIHVEDINTNDILGKGDIEPPITSGGLIPIKWNGTSWIDTITSDPEWYDYTEQSAGTAGGGTSKWANARTTSGSMVVWIPRYEYKIVSGNHSNIKGEIEIKFISVSQTTADNGYIIHPAFRNDANNGGWDRELEGFWVGKFESSNDGSNNVKILPNVTSWVSISANTAFEKAKVFANNNSLNNYDSHMMKNTEWGAVSYLAHSQYGRNGTQVTINNSSSYLTGRAGGTVTDSTSSTNGTHEYDTTQGVLASTTGNIYGVYDMSGGGWEYVMGVYNNKTGLSGMSTLPENKYYDNYPTSYSSCDLRKGDAIYETSSTGNGYTTWFSSTSNYVTDDAPWFLRGGSYNNGSTVGLFAFNNYSGTARSNTTFRIICIAP